MSSEKKRPRTEEKEEEEEAAAAPAAETEKKKKEEEEVKGTAGADGSTVFELGSKRRLVVKTFKGRRYVDLREWYTDDGGELKPGKKGISLTPEQWAKVKLAASQVDALLR